VPAEMLVPVPAEMLVPVPAEVQDLVPAEVQDQEPEAEPVPGWQRRRRECQWWW